MSINCSLKRLRCVDDIIVDDDMVGLCLLAQLDFMAALYALFMYHSNLNLIVQPVTIIVRTTPAPSLARHTPLGSGPTGWVHHQHMYEQGRNRSPPSFTTPRSCQFDVLDAPLTTVQRGGRGRGRSGVGVALTSHSRNKNMKITLYGAGKLNGSCKTLNCNDARLTVRYLPPTSLLLSPLKLV